MDETQFWLLVDETRKQAGGNANEHIKTLENKLNKLSFDELTDFADFWGHFHGISYHWTLWTAAYIIGGGCSDDGFMDFRDWVISKGQNIFEAALKEPDSLAQLSEELAEHGGRIEGFSYIPSKVVSEKWSDKKDQFDDELLSRARKRVYPIEPAGEEWEEDDDEVLERLCPRLYELFW